MIEIVIQMMLMLECCVVSFPGPLGLVSACLLEDFSFLVDLARFVLLVIASRLENQKIDAVIVAVAFVASVVAFAAVAL